MKIYKQSFALIFLLAMLAQTFTQGFYYLNYLVDRSAFEKNCINKAKAWLHCNGKCQLMKKLIEHEKKEQQQPELKLAGKTEVFSFHSLYIPFLLPPDVTGHRKYSPCCAGLPIDQPCSFFHPPSV